MCYARASSDRRSSRQYFFQAIAQLQAQDLVEPPQALAVDQTLIGGSNWPILAQPLRLIHLLLEAKGPQHSTPGVLVGVVGLDAEHQRTQGYPQGPFEGIFLSQIWPYDVSLAGHAVVVASPQR